MACQFIPGYREASSPNRNQADLPIPGLIEAEKKAVNRPVSDLPIAEESAVIILSPVTDHGRPAAEGPAAVRTTINVFVNQQDAPTCPNCGHVAVRNGKEARAIEEADKRLRNRPQARSRTLCPLCESAN